MRSFVAELAVLCLLAGCAKPPPSAYVGGAASAAQGEGISLGANASGETCSQLPSGAEDTVDVFCGSWQQPAARIRADGSSADTTPMSAATAGSWRETIDLRYVCNAPVPTSILGGEQAVVLQCTRRVGGWPQIAMVASVDGRIYQAYGILPTLPVIERSIGVLSGRTTATSAALPPSAADALLAPQLAAHAFSAGDVGEYERLMSLGARANLAENFAAAEIAYRAALALEQRKLGRDNPDTVTALMHLALQVSDQGRFTDADALFKQADALAPRASDKAAVARLQHYRALHALNQGRNEQALTLLQSAESGYAALVPRDSLTPNVQLASVGGASDLAIFPGQGLTLDPTTQSALIGLIEARRYRAIVLRQLGRPTESAAAIASAESLARANHLSVPLVSARLSRTTATTEDVNGNVVAAASGLSFSRQNFTQIVPRTRPVAETALLQAGVAAKQGDPSRTIELCRIGITLLRDLRSGTDPALLEPCLASFAAEAQHRSGERQRLLMEMFETAELAQDSLTSREIDEAAARLAANARDPRVAEAIRRRQDTTDALAELYRQRDALAGRASPESMPSDAPIDPAALDKKIAATQADLADADAALQAAAPNYAQLVQQVVPTADVLGALAPNEALAAITPTKNGGWVFLLRDGTIDVAPMKGDAASITDMVKRVRASIESPTGSLPQFDTRSAQGLYDATLAQVTTRLTGVKALVVAPSGALLSLPFALLLTGPADPTNLAAAPWLNRQMTIAHVPSAANFVTLRKAGNSQAAHPWFGFGDFRPVTLAQAEASFPGASCMDSAKLFASLPPLPYAQRELVAARTLLGAPASAELLNTAFTADAVRHAALKDYRILHFAAHALLPSELHCQNEPAIVTSAPPRARDASGALLTTSDITGLDLDADLVILSACNSGGPGGTTAGASLSGLARAFFYAGARSLEVTHWSVNDQVAAFLVADTLRRLRENPNLGIAGALRDAQLAMLADAGKGMPAEIAHPFFWAAFAVIGEGGGRGAISAERRISPHRLAGL